jgi:hypothetical protein
MTIEYRIQYVHLAIVHGIGLCLTLAPSQLQGVAVRIFGFNYSDAVTFGIRVAGVVWLVFWTFVALVNIRAFFFSRW